MQPRRNKEKANFCTHVSRVPTRTSVIEEREEKKTAPYAIQGRWCEPAGMLFSKRQSLPGHKTPDLSFPNQP